MWGSARAEAGAVRRAGPTLTPVAGMVTVTELVDRLDVVGRLDRAIGPRCTAAQPATGEGLNVSGAVISTS